MVINPVYIDIPYFDFHKVFNSIPHENLLSKLLSYDIQEELCEWLCEFITSSSQRVVLNGKLSDWIIMRSVYPKAVSCAPSFFNYLHVNDIP